MSNPRKNDIIIFAFQPSQVQISKDHTEVQRVTYLLSREFWCDSLMWQSGGGMMVPSGVHCCTGGELADAAPELSSDLIPSSTEHITPFLLPYVQHQHFAANIRTR